MHRLLSQFTKLILDNFLSVKNLASLYIVSIMYLMNYMYTVVTA